MIIIDFLKNFALTYLAMGSYLSIGFIGFITALFGVLYIIEKREGGFCKKEIKRKAALTYMMNENSSFINCLAKNIINLFFYINMYVILFLLYVIIEEKHRTYFDKLIKVIIEFEGIFISFTALTITAVIFVITLTPKKYYLFFSKNDIFKKYHLGKLFVGICLTCFVTVIVSMLLLSVSLKKDLGLVLMGVYFTMVLLNMILDCFALIIIWHIGFNDSKFELKMLRRLNNIFNDNRKLFSIQTTDEFALYQNLSFLLYDYQLLVRNKKFKTIYNYEKVSFRSIDEDEIMLKKANHRFLIFFVVLAFISLICSIISKCTYKFIIGNVAVSVIYSLMIFCLWNKNSIAKFIMKFVYPSSGYFFAMEKNENEKFVGCSAMWRKNIFDKYILSCKNIMAFYCNICDAANSNSTEQKGETINIYIIQELYKESLLALDEDVKESEKWKDFIIKLPIILSSYFYYIKFKNVPACVGEFIDKKDFTQKEIDCVRKLVYSFIIDISRFRVIQAKEDNISMNYKNLEDLERYIIESGFFESLFSVKKEENKMRNNKKK